MTVEKFRLLAKYGACDISDALLKLGVRNAGHLALLSPIAPYTRSSLPTVKPPKIIAPASTVLFGHKKNTTPDEATSTVTSNIPSDAHWVDLTTPGTVVVMAGPMVWHSAILGGIMALRMKKLGAKAVVCPGTNVRDVEELQQLDMPIWAKSSTTVGAGLQYKPRAVNIPVWAGQTLVSPGDIIFIDPASGVVAIPAAKVDSVLELLPKLVEADDKVKEAVEAGSSVHEAFAKFRSKL